MSASGVSPPSNQARRWQAVQGKFENDTWYCACDPPLKASFLQVKKAGNNAGRWFYNCQMPRGDQCGFFLFEDAARVLERRAQTQTAEKRAEPSIFNRPLAAQINSPAGPSNGSPAGNRPSPASHIQRANYNLGHATRSVRSDSPFSEAASAVTAPLYSPASSVFGTPAPRLGIFRGIPRLGDKSWSSDDEDSDVTADLPAKSPTKSAAKSPTKSTAKSPTKSAAKSPGKSPATYQSNLHRYLGLSTPTPKRKRSSADNGDAGRNNNGTNRNDAVVILSDLDSDDADDLVELADSTERQLHSSSHPSSQTNGPPSGARSGSGGLPTPETGNSFISASGDRPSTSKRFKNALGLAAPPTPTPTRNRNGFPGAAAPNHNQPKSRPTTEPPYYPSEEEDAPITSTILSLLQPQPPATTATTTTPQPMNIPPHIQHTIRTALNTHARCAKGVERARDGLRDTLRVRDRCIADLRARVDRLETERRLRQEVLRSDLEALSQGGEGGGNNNSGGGGGGGDGVSVGVDVDVGVSDGEGRE